MANYPSQSKVGVDLNNPGSTQLFALGEMCEGTNGSVWVYVEAGTAITAYKCVAIPGTYTCGMASATDILKGSRLGYAQSAFTSGQFGWVPIAGGTFGVLTTGSVSLSTQISVAASSLTTGTTSTVTTGSGTIQGLVFVSVAQTASATVSGAVLSFPKPLLNHQG